MTDEKLNIAICEARGWKWLKDHVHEGDWWMVPSHTVSGYKPKLLHAHGEWQGNVIGGIHRLPNHVTGIEALGHLNEAEEELLITTEQICEYHNNLIQQIGSGASIIDWIFHAKPRKRAIALAKTLGIWVSTIPQPTEQNPTAGNVEPRLGKETLCEAVERLAKEGKTENPIFL